MFLFAVQLDRNLGTLPSRGGGNVTEVTSTFHWISPHVEAPVQNGIHYAFACLLACSCQQAASWNEQYTHSELLFFGRKQVQK